MEKPNAFELISLRHYWLSCLLVIMGKIFPKYISIFLKQIPSFYMKCFLVSFCYLWDGWLFNSLLIYLFYCFHHDCLQMPQYNKYLRLHLKFSSNGIICWIWVRMTISLFNDRPSGPHCFLGNVGSLWQKKIFHFILSEKVKDLFFPRTCDLERDFSRFFSVSFLTVSLIISFKFTITCNDSSIY